MELPLHQSNIIQAMQSGCKLWSDNFGKTTYHIRMKRAVKTINQQTISALIYRGLITDGLELTEMGKAI